MMYWVRCGAVVGLGALGCAEVGSQDEVAEVGVNELALKRKGHEWLPAVTVDRNPQGSAFNPVIAALGGGAAVAAWYQYDGPRPDDPEPHYNVWASQWPGGPAWGAPQPLVQGYWSPRELLATGTRDGQALLGFHGPFEGITVSNESVIAFDDGRWGESVLLQSRVFDRGGHERTVFVGARSGHALRLNTDGWGSFGTDVAAWRWDGEAWSGRASLNEWTWTWPEAPDGAIDEAGNALALWGEEQWYHGASEDEAPPTMDVVQVSRLAHDATAWSEPVVLDKFLSPGWWLARAAVALSADGKRGLATWTGEHGLRYARFERKRGWSSSRDLGVDTVINELEIDLKGRAITLGVRDNTLVAARYDWGKDAWVDLGILAAATSDDMDRLPPLAELSVASEPGGGAVAAWTQVDVGRYRAAWATHYEPGKGWDPPRPLDPAGPYEAGSPAVAIDEDGYAFAIWHQRTGKHVDIHASRYK